MSILQMLLATASKENYWISIIGSSNRNHVYITTFFDISVDSSGNVYACYPVKPIGVFGDIIVFKYNKNGILQWQKVISGINLGYTVTAYSIDLDSSGNIYICGTSTLSSNTDLLVIKLDADANIQWQKTLGGSSTDSSNKLFVDSSGNIYIAAQTQSQGSGSTDCLIVKYDTNGNLQWQRILGGITSDGYTDLSVDSSNNCYVVGAINANGNSIIAKYDSDGNLQWQRSLNDAGNSFSSIATDSVGNSYCCGNVNLGGNTELLIVKYDTNGNLQWQKSLGFSGSGTEAAYNICLDNFGYFYVVGGTNAFGFNDAIVLKYDTDGNLQWQRSFGGNASASMFEDGYGIDVDSNSNLYFSGITIDQSAAPFINRKIFIVRVPGDGSKTGTYGNYSYSTPNLVVGITTLTGVASTQTTSTSTLTGAASTLGISTSTLFTYTTTEIP